MHVYYGDIDDNHYEQSLMMGVMNLKAYVDDYEENFVCKNHNDNMMNDDMMMMIVTMMMVVIVVV